MRRRTSWAAVCFCGCIGIVATGRGRLSADDAAPSEIPETPVSLPVERQITDFADFTGRTEAAQTVKIISRVTGHLIGAPFKEGGDVKRGDLLFEIDPRPYQAQVDQAQRQLELNEASLTAAKADNARAKQLAKTPGAIGEPDLDRYQSAENEAAASVLAAKSSVTVHKLNLMFCHITSPIDGQVGQYLLTPGNLVKQDETVLTTVVSSDPMFVYFDMDQQTLLRIRRAINDGQMKRPEGETFPITIGLQDEPAFPHSGTISFFGNRVDSSTGTIVVRATVQNLKPAGGARLMLPGMFVRVRLPLSKPHAAIFVSERAILRGPANDSDSDPSTAPRRLYILDANNAAEYRRVEIGVEVDGMREIRSGLKPNERVVVDGFAHVEPNTTVRPKLVPMPTKKPARSK